MKSNADIKKALSICKAWTGCQYETNPECPYRITDCSCDLSGLISDANKLVSDLEEDNEDKRERITNAAKALGYDCDECDRW